VKEDAARGSGRVHRSGIVSGCQPPPPSPSQASLTGLTDWWPLPAALDGAGSLSALPPAVMFFSHKAHASSQSAPFELQRIRRAET
jgi:hypothetical protein